MSTALLALFCMAAPGQDLRSAGDAPLHAVRFVDRSEGWAAGSDGVIWHTIDAGSTWERQPAPTRGELQALQFLTPYTGYAAGREEVQALGGSVGVLLATKDGGLTWNRLAPNAVPGIHAVKFFDDRNGVVAGDGNDRWPGGIFRTTDGGASWQPTPAVRGGGWRGAAFFDRESAALAGSWGRLGVLRSGAFRPADVDPPGGRHVRAIAHHGKRTVAVGQGGLVLVSQDGGLGYQFADLGISPDVLSLADFRGVCCVDDHVWIVGSPGTVVFHSGDGGATWERFTTSQTAPLNAVHFVDAKHGWAVGELGTILASQDGGKSWVPQRRGGQRAAVLCIHAAGRNVPLDLLAAVGGDGGYLMTTIAVTTADTSASPARASDDLRLRVAVRKVGGVAAEVLHGFPIPAPMSASDRDALLAHWNLLHSGRAADRMLEQLVATIRTWQPDVVVCDFAGGQAESIVVEAVQAAVAKAGEREFAPDMERIWRLSEWQVKKSYALWDGPGAPQVVVATADFAPGLGDAPREFADRVVGLIAERGSLPRQRGLRVLANRLPERTASGLMDGTNLAPGGTARRHAQVGAGANSDAEQQHHKLKTLQAVSHIQGPGTSGAALASMSSTLDKLPADQAANTLLSIAGQYARTGQLALARETYQLAARKYDGQPAGLEALRWLVRYHASSEWRRRDEMQQRVSLMRADFRAGDQAPTRDDPFRVGGGVRTLADATTQEHTAVLSDPRRARAWHEQALACATRITAYGPVAEGDPALHFGMAAARRTLGVPDGSWLRKFVAEQAGQAADDPWRVTARQELWLQERNGLPPRFAAACRKTVTRPYLDAKLDDDCWTDATPLGLRHAAGRVAADDYAAKASFAYDDEFLYLAIECKYPAAVAQPAVERRTRDMDLENFDRVEVLLDLDRDYQTYYRFRVDQRGGLAEDCCDDAGWNPRWFVAFASGPEGYVIEAAIVRSDLTGDVLPPGRSWAINVVRIVPGQGVLAASLPAGSAPRPEGMGLLTLIDANHK